MKFKYIFSLILLLSSISSTFSVTKEDIWDDFKSPINTDAKYIFWTGTILTVGISMLKDQVVDPLQKRISEAKPLGGAAPYADYAGRLIPNGVYFVYMGMDYLLTDDKVSAARANLMFKATLYSALVTNALKYTIREPRPACINERNSFPSGHTTTAFAFASVVGMAHPWYAGVLAYTMATVAAIGRMNDNRHFLHDVVAGATIGTSYGVGLGLKNKSKIGASTSYIFNVLPTEDLMGTQFLFVYNY